MHRIKLPTYFSFAFYMEKGNLISMELLVFFLDVREKGMSYLEPLTLQF